MITAAVEFTEDELRALENIVSDITEWSHDGTLSAIMPRLNSAILRCMERNDELMKIVRRNDT